MFTFSASALQVLWEKLTLPPMPIELMVPPQGVEEHERRVVIESGLKELHSNGFLHDDEPRAELLDSLRLLARPEYTVDGRLWAGRPVRALAACARGRAAIGVLSADRFSVRHVEPGALAREVVALLPPLGAGPGGSVCVPSAALGAAASKAGDLDPVFVEELVANGVTGVSVRRLRNMIEGRGNGAQFGATVLGHNGKARRADRVVACFDTPRGRYSIEDNRGWTTIAPVDAQRLTGQVDRLLADLPGGVLSRSRPSGSR